MESVEFMFLHRYREPPNGVAALWLSVPWEAVNCFLKDPAMDAGNNTAGIHVKDALKATTKNP